MRDQPWSPAAPAYPAAASGPLRPDLPVWGFFGRSLLVILGVVFILPAPWTYAAYFRHVIGHTRLPNGARLGLSARSLALWPVFLGLALFNWADGAASEHHPLASLFVNAVIGALYWAVLRWMVGALTAEGRPLGLRFEGSLWRFVGWHLLTLLSIVTLIGWAWVLKYAWCWSCAQVRGELSLRFTAGGWDILWRTVLAGLACGLILPIPWVIQLYANWLIAQIEVTPQAGQPAAPPFA